MRRRECAGADTTPRPRILGLEYRRGVGVRRRTAQRDDGGNQESPLACRGYHPPRVASHSHTCFPFPLISPRPSSATRRSDERGNGFPRLGDAQNTLSCSFPVGNGQNLRFLVLCFLLLAPPTASTNANARPAVALPQSVFR